MKKENASIKIKNKFKKFFQAQNILIALTAFVLILKFNYSENKMIRMKKILQYLDDLDITLQDLYEMEISALKLIDYDLSFHTPYSFMELFLINGIIFNEDYLQLDASFKIYDLAKETIENIMEMSNDYFKYNYFYLCCCIISYVRDTIHINKWPKVFEINFGIKFDDFSDVYNIFFQKNNNEKIENNMNIKINKRNFYNSDIINIKNLKSINNIINVLKIMKSADKIKRVKEKINKIDLVNNNNNNNINNNIPNENKIEQYNNNNIQANSNSNSANKIKVSLKKNHNALSFKSPEKAKISKSSIPYLISKINEENINRVSSLYIKSTEKDEINELENATNKYSLARSYNKYRRNINKKEKNIIMNNNSYINSFKRNLESSYVSNNKNNLINFIDTYKSKKKENKDNILNKSNINVYNQSFYKAKNYKYFDKNTEKKIKQEISENDTLSKNKEENSEIPTCESSDPKLSFNDFSIRKTYRNKKLKNDAGGDPRGRDGVEKKNFFNKLKNTKISGNDNLCGRKIGVRKFYKQKNLEENKYS